MVAGIGLPVAVQVAVDTLHGGELLGAHGALVFLIGWAWWMWASSVFSSTKTSERQLVAVDLFVPLQVAQTDEGLVAELARYGPCPLPHPGPGHTRLRSSAWVTQHPLLEGVEATQESCGLSVTIYGGVGVEAERRLEAIPRAARKQGRSQLFDSSWAEAVQLANCWGSGRREWGRAGSVWTCGPSNLPRGWQRGGRARRGGAFPLDNTCLGLAGCEYHPATGAAVSATSLMGRVGRGWEKSHQTRPHRPSGQKEISHLIQSMGLVLPCSLGGKPHWVQWV